MQDQSIWFLENIDVSGIFCENKMSDAIEAHVHKVYSKGEYIYLPDQAADKIYFIIEGRVKIGSLNDQNKEIIKAILSRGELFGELSLIGEVKRRDFAIAIEKTTCCLMTVFVRKDKELVMNGLCANSIHINKLQTSRQLPDKQ